jgi:ABC-type nitrate/sulfonate/bicarbonate transport system substrate-binding protein
MRGKAVFLVILALLVGLVYLIGTRTRDAHVVPKPKAEEPAEASAPGTHTANEAGAAIPETPSTDGGGAPDAHAGLMDRPLRVVASSWELAASLLVANGGKTTADGSVFRERRLEAQVDVATSEADVENRLARGGADAEGADVAVVPLPALVASYERIRALEPEVLRLVGWSRGREVLFGTKDAVLARPGVFPGDVTVIADDASAEALALFALDEAGTLAAKVHFVKDAKDAPLAAVARPIPGDRSGAAPSKIELTTADASRLVPLVAVASRGFVEGHPQVVVELLRAWGAGRATLRKDVPAAARRIASEEGAPQPAEVLERIAWVDDPDAPAQANVAGALGDEARAVSRMFEREWRLFRDAGVLVTPMPPIESVVVVEKVGAGTHGDAGRPPPPPPAADPTAHVLLAHRVPKGDAEAVATDVALLAEVFPRSGLRITGKPSSLAQAAAAAATDAHGVKSDRLVVAPGTLAGADVALVEVLAAP